MIALIFWRIGFNITNNESAYIFCKSLKLNIDKVGVILRQTFFAIGFLLFVVALWGAVIGPLGLVSSARFPSPSETYEAFKLVLMQGYGNGLWHQHVFQSSMLVLISFAASAGLGILLGIAMGSSRRVETFVNPVFLSLRPIPPLAWIPLAIVWFGLGNDAKVMVIFVAAFVPAVINTFTGVRSLEVSQREAAEMLGISRKAYYLEVLIPAAMPMIFTGSHGRKLIIPAAWNIRTIGHYTMAIAWT